MDVAKIEWRAHVEWEFRCPQCSQWLPEGNPLVCPHQVGHGLHHDRVQVVLETCVNQEETPPLVKSAFTTEELSKAMSGCSKPGG